MRGKLLLFIYSVLLVTELANCASLPDDRYLEIHEDLYEGDIIPNVGAFNGIRGDKYRWPNKIVPYELDAKFNSSELAKISLGWTEIANKTCVRFRLRQRGEQHYVYIRKGAETSGCYSNIGRVGGRQALHFAPGCLRHGTIVHEMLHTIGFLHEQGRPDRDDYVTIVWDKIEPGKENIFNKYSEKEVDTMGAPYDYGSVLHYTATFYSIDGSPTIIPKDPNAEIGQRLKISDIDALKVNIMYNCTDYLPPIY